MRANVAALILFVVASSAIQVAATPMPNTPKFLGGSSSRNRRGRSPSPPQQESDGSETDSPRTPSSREHSPIGSPQGSPPGPQGSPPPPQTIDYNRFYGGRNFPPRGYNEGEVILNEVYEPRAANEYRASAFWARDGAGYWWFYPPQRQGRRY